MLGRAFGTFSSGAGSLNTVPGQCLLDSTYATVVAMPGVCVATSGLPRRRDQVRLRVRCGSATVSILRLKRSS